MTDTKNKNKSLYDKLLIKKTQNTLDIKELTLFDWQQLIIKEKISSKNLANIFTGSEYSINKIRKEYICRIKDYCDEYEIYKFLLHVIDKRSLFNDLSVRLLETIERLGYKYIYDSELDNYTELANIEEEISIQKQLAIQNYNSPTYKMPFIGKYIIRLYYVIKNKKPDKKVNIHDHFLNQYSQFTKEYYVKFIEDNDLENLYKHGIITQVLTNELIYKKKNNEKLNIKDLTEFQWKQLYLKENNTVKSLSEIFDTSQYMVTKYRNKFLTDKLHYNINKIYRKFLSISLDSNINEFLDIISNQNFIYLLSPMNPKREVYTYDETEPWKYKTLFKVCEEYDRQNEILEYNKKNNQKLPTFSDIMLKEFYISHKQNQDTEYFFSENLDTIKQLIKYIEKKDLKNKYKDFNYYNYFEMDLENIKQLNTYQANKDTEYIAKEYNIKTFDNHIIKKSINKSKGNSNINYIKAHKNMIISGQSGENIVYNSERHKLKNTSYYDLIEKTSEIDSNAGYDIKSYDLNGNEIFIEVKTSNNINDGRAIFNISDNEDKFLKTNKNTFIYYVKNSNKPEIFIISSEQYNKMNKKCVKYEINLDYKI